MAKCKICGVSVQAGPAMHGHCLEELVEKAAEEVDGRLRKICVEKFEPWEARYERNL